MANGFTNEQLAKAMDIIAKGNVPSWMNSFEKQAWALGVITEEDIVPHDRCDGRGWVPGGPYADDMCSCPGGTGRVITEMGKAKIKVAFPDYQIR